LSTCLAFSKVNSSEVITSSMTPPMLILGIHYILLLIEIYEL
jgi:hypothetical protein